MYKKVISNGYIVMAGDLYNGEEISNAEYQLIVNAFENRPADESGYTYKLRADNLEWELVKLPDIEPAEDEAGPEDYEQALQQMGVDFSD